MTDKTKDFLKLIDCLTRASVVNNFSGLFAQFQAVKLGFEEFNTSG
jgi:hypothetical protein